MRNLEALDKPLRAPSHFSFCSLRGQACSRCGKKRCRGYHCTVQHALSSHRRRLRAISLYQSGSARSENMGAGRHFVSGEATSGEERRRKPVMPPLPQVPLGSFARSSLAESCRAGLDSFAPAISLPGRLTEQGLLAVYHRRGTLLPPRNTKCPLKSDSFRWSCLDFTRGQSFFPDNGRALTARMRTVLFHLAENSYRFCHTNGKWSLSSLEYWRYESREGAPKCR